MKIAIINQPLNNRGDESAHRALMRRLNQSFPQVQIEVLFLNSSDKYIEPFKVQNKNNTYVNIPFHWNRIYTCMIKGWYLLAMMHFDSLRFMSHLLKADYVICAPGGICLGGFQNVFHLLTLCIAKLSRKKLIYWGRSIGPFSEENGDSTRFKKKAIEMLKYCKFISLRDRESQLIADELQIPYHKTLDTAFLECPQAEIPEKINNSLQKEYIVFVPNNLLWHYKYRDIKPVSINDFWIKVISLLMVHYPNTQIVMLPQTYYTVKNDGYNFFKMLAKQSGHDNIYVVPDTFGSDVQQAIISKAKLLIGARYHSIVFAINNETPFIALSYEHKIKGLLESLDYTANMVDIEHTFKDIGSQISTLDKIESLLTGHSTPSNVKAKAITEECFRTMIEYIESDIVNSRKLNTV